MFGFFVKIKNIDLEYNRIRVVDENIFENATNLEEVSFNSNKLERIPKNLFKKNLKLENIWFKTNSITFVDPSMFDDLESLKQVVFGNNLCIDGWYFESNFDEMRKDLRENCNKYDEVSPAQDARVVFCTAFIQVWRLRNEIQISETCKPDIDEADEDFAISSSTSQTVSAFIIEHKPGVKALPTNLLQNFPDLITLQVLNCSVTSINGYHFKGLAKLRFLSLARNKIEIVASDAFVDLVNLEQLLLSFNRIKTLVGNTFSTLKALKVLQLGENKIQVLQPKIFGELVSVELINLKQNKIHSVDENIFENAKNLKGISLAANELTSIPKNLFKNNLKLEKISINTNNIKEIDATMFDHLSSLKFVSLHNNSCIDKTYNRTNFDSMKNDLKENCNKTPTGIAANSGDPSDGVAASENGAREILCTTFYTRWTWINTSRKLETCHPNVYEVDDKNFTISNENDETTLAFRIDDEKGVRFLPTNLHRVMPDLIVFQVYNCSVTSVDGNHFKGLSELEYLNLAYNKIKHVAADAFVYLVSLEYLGLSNNRIYSLGENTFASLTELVEIYLEHNKILVLHPKIFRSIEKMENINLDQNKISALDENILEFTTNLKNVSFSANRLEKVPKNLFRNNLKLEKIWFDTNNIEFIDANMFDHLTNIEYVDLEGNACIDKFYESNDFDAMRIDLKEHCNEKPQEISPPTLSQGLGKGEIDML